MADSDFERYRSAYDGQPIAGHSLETFGINNEPAYQLAVADPQSVIIAWNGGLAPILTPLSNLSDRNFVLYRRLADAAANGPTGPMYYYSNLASGDTYDEDIVATISPTIATMAAQRGLFVYDAPRQSAEQTDSAVAALLERIGGIACEPVTGMPAHYHYVLELGLSEDAAPHVERPLDLVALFPQAIADGALGQNQAIDVTGTLSEADRMHVAGYYAKRHAGLTEQDATDAGFSPASLDRVLADPQYVKIAYWIGGQIANLSILADPRNCPWIDQMYLREGHPSHYDEGRMLVGIGAISDPEAPQGLALSTFNVIRRLIAYAGGRAVLAIATDDVSNQYIPRMSIAMLESAGLNPTPTEAVSGVVFRSLVLRPEA